MRAAPLALLATLAAAPVAGDPTAPVAGDPAAPVAGDPAAPVAGDPAAPVAGDPAAPVAGDPLPPSLTGRPGDPARGRAVVVDRTRGLCLLCHAGPFPEQRFQGDLSPSLAGVGARYTEGELRLRLIDARRLNPDTIMPSYYRTDGLSRVGPAWSGRTILSADEIEDAVAFLATLRD